MSIVEDISFLLHEFPPQSHSVEVTESSGQREIIPGTGGHSLFGFVDF